MNDPQATSYFIPDNGSKWRELFKLIDLRVMNTKLRNSIGMVYTNAQSHHAPSLSVLEKGGTSAMQRESGDRRCNFIPKEEEAATVAEIQKRQNETNRTDDGVKSCSMIAMKWLEKTATNNITASLPYLKVPADWPDVVTIKLEPLCDSGDAAEGAICKAIDAFWNDSSVTA